MGNSGGKITAPVSLHNDVYPVLGMLTPASGRFYDLGIAVQSGRVNMWSRKKPIRVANITRELTDAEFQAANYGLTQPTVPQTTNPLDSTWQSQKWTYNYPDGTTYPFRLTDFVGYFHNEAPPTGAPTNLEFSAVTPEHTIYFGPNKFSGTNVMSLSSMPAVKDYYPCVVIYSENGKGGYRYKTAGQTFANGGQSITINRTELGTSTTKYTYLLCGFNNPKTSLSSESIAGHFIILPSDSILRAEMTYITSVQSQMHFTPTGIVIGTVSSGATKLPLSIKNFQTMSTNPSQNHYAYVNGGIMLVFNIKNETSSTVNLVSTSITFGCLNNLSGGTTQKGFNHSGMFTVSDRGVFTSASAISFTSGQTKQVAFALSSYLFGNTVQSVAASCTIQYYYNSTLAGGANLNVTNNESLSSNGTVS